MKQYAKLVVLSGTRVTDQLFTYSIPQRLSGCVQIGMRVRVPFGRGNRLLLALVLQITTEAPPQGTDEKEIVACLDEEPVIGEEAIRIAHFLAEQALSDYTSAFSVVLPPRAAETLSPKTKQYYRVTDSGKAAQCAPNALRQIKALDALKNAEMLERTELLRQSGASTATLASLEKKGWIVRETQRIRRRAPRTVSAYERRALSAEQQRVFEQVHGSRETFLLCGVTGSGKTEIYLQLAEAVLREGKEVIILVPEISLTPQTIARFQGRFGDRIAVLHSRLTPAQRAEEWARIASGEVSIAIGARSAIFAPFSRLGLIVIDEEHEQSYYSEQNPKYHAHDIARIRSDYHGCPLILGSATPSLDSLYRVEQGDWRRLNLAQRAGSGAMPEIHVVDMREELKANNRSMFSAALREAIAEALSRKEQVILFLNKRGHTSYVFCRSCGYVYRCEACDVAMTYHKHRDRLICHYCGRQRAHTRKCPQCGSDAVREFGAGTEQLEEEAVQLFPHAVIRRADADTMHVKGAYEQVYDQMQRGGIDILIGTQMIAKGLDFPNVTVVGIMAADLTLNLPDFRACERAFQLFTQVSGRAGRGAKAGHVFIQTYKPDHYAIRCAVSHDVDLFYKKEMAVRQANAQPPLTTELHVGISGADRRACWEKCIDIRDALMKIQSAQENPFGMQGPAPAVIERIDRKYRFGISLRSADRILLRRIGRYLMKKFPTGPSLNIVVTMDPRSVY